jgi:hypothetical protein
VRILSLPAAAVPQATRTRAGSLANGFIGGPGALPRNRSGQAPALSGPRLGPAQHRAPLASMAKELPPWPDWFSAGKGIPMKDLRLASRGVWPAGRGIGKAPRACPPFQRTEASQGQRSTTTDVVGQSPGQAREQAAWRLRRVFWSACASRRTRRLGSASSPCTPPDQLLGPPGRLAGCRHRGRKPQFQPGTGRWGAAPQPPLPSTLSHGLRSPGEVSGASKTQPGHLLNERTPEGALCLRVIAAGSGRPARGGGRSARSPAGAGIQPVRERFCR